MQKRKESNKKEFAKALKEAIGCAKSPNDKNFDYKKEYRKILEKKYLK